MYLIPGMIVFILVSATFMFNSCASFGSSAKGKRLERIKKSENYKEGKFANNIPTILMKKGRSFGTLMNFIFDRTVQREPDILIPTIKIKKDAFNSPPESGLRVTWIGHSTLLIEIDNYIILTDPVLGMRASPYNWAGPKRFYDPTASVLDLPDLDAVIISHDHHDHLNSRDIKGLIPKTKIFYMPLGVGAHLEGWGVPPEKIIELDWWEEHRINDDILFVCTPARHFSGRGIFDRNKTLWASWVILGSKHRIYFSGDSGYFPTYKEIGDRYGPFDISLMHIGAYSDNWPLIHTNPEQAVQAHIDLKSDVFLPIHWGTFNLSMHTWDDPIERTIKAVEKANIRLVIPKPGESITIDNIMPISFWWRRDLPEKNSDKSS